MDMVAARMSDSTEELQSVMAALGPCVEKLKTQERRLIHNHYMLGATVKAAAATLGHSPESAYKLLQRIRRKLFDCVRRAVRREDSP
jgi:DNA-directed RNA polymerase specialized sigma24 family protein